MGSGSVRNILGFFEISEIIFYLLQNGCSFLEIPSCRISTGALLPSPMVVDAFPTGHHIKIAFAMVKPDRPQPLLRAPSRGPNKWSVCSSIKNPGLGLE